MYLRNIFNSKPAQVIATVGSLAFGLYNLYIMGRTDEIVELCDLVESQHREGFNDPHLKFKNVHGKEYSIRLSKDEDDCDS